MLASDAGPKLSTLTLPHRSRPVRAGTASSRRQLGGVQPLRTDCVEPGVGAGSSVQGNPHRTGTDPADDVSRSWQRLGDGPISSPSSNGIDGPWAGVRSNGLEGMNGVTHLVEHHA